MTARYHVTAVHSEQRSLFHVCDRSASGAEQPAILATFSDRTIADRLAECLNTPAEPGADLPIDDPIASCARLLAEHPAGYVQEPGKFEAEPIAAVYFWEISMNGFAAETLYDGDTPIDVFPIKGRQTLTADQERELWHLRADTAFVAVWESDQGFVHFDEWTAEEYRRAIDRAEENAGPQEEDITTEDYRTFYQYGRVAVKQNADGRTWSYAGGRGVFYLLGEYGDDHRAALRAYMGRVQYWPNVWAISDHGNAHLLTLSSEKE